MIGRRTGAPPVACALRSVLAAACVLTAAVLVTPSTTAAAASVGGSGIAGRPSAGCTLAQPATPGTTDRLLAAAGDDGAYVREIPPSYTGRTPVPLVVDLHGYEEPATGQVAMSDLGAYGASHGFVTVTPQVAGAIPMWQTGLHSRDMAFLGALLDTAEATLCVDRARVYVTGLSNGAFMTSAVACVYADRVAAVAPVAGIQTPAGCHPSRPVPVVAFHGTADPFVAYGGGLGPSALALPAPDGSGRTVGQLIGPNGAGRAGPSVPSITATWARRNGCAAHPTSRAVAAGVTEIAYRCPGGADVDLYRITGGGHAWPGSAVSQAVGSVVGYTTMAISADAIIWRFFEAHPLRG